MIKTLLFTTLISLNTFAADDLVNIWPTIPFIRGADLCRYSDAYSQSRSDFMAKMSGLAGRIMYSGAYGDETLALLKSFNQLYDRNLSLAVQGNHLDVTLESTLKSYISGYYRDLHPRVQKISFTTLNDTLRAVKTSQPVPPAALAQLTYMAYGTYALAPDCQGDIQVTLHLVGANGTVRSYLGHSTPAVVMSQIASQIFTDFQRTHFPSVVKVGNKNLTLIGGLSGSVDKVSSPEIARLSCETLSARLPEPNELEILNAYGDWSGGVSLGEKVWALSSGKVFAPTMRHPSPIRNVSETGETEFYYYCVRD